MSSLTCQKVSGRLVGKERTEENIEMHYFGLEAAAVADYLTS